MKTNTLLKRFGIPALIVLAVAGTVMGYVIGRSGNVPQTSVDQSVAVDVAGIELVADSHDSFWTCSMHPQIREEEPGQCPICGMDMIPVSMTASVATNGPRELTLSPSAERIAEIQVVPVERRYVTREISVVGKVAPDETRLAYISSWVPGRIDRLYVDFTGVTVRAGDRLADVYSPALYAAQEEYRQALRAEAELASSSLGTAREAAHLTAVAAREKLRLLGMKPLQIADFELSGQMSDQVAIYSPATGVVLHRDATAGMYVDAGTRIYTVADLSQVWVLLDVYESDLSWIRLGQEVSFASEAWPGEIFTGRVSFIDPVVNNQTRTVRVRVDVPNPDGRLKPDMFVRADIRSGITSGGTVIDPALAMEDIAASLRGNEAPLVIPRSAPLITGERAVVYVRDPDHAGTYVGREVVLGSRAGDYYQVVSGLGEGELVVVNGSFKLDSALQIHAQPSMMSPDGGVAPAAHNHSAGMSATVQFAQMTDMSGMTDMEGMAGDGGMTDMPATDPMASMDHSMADMTDAAGMTYDIPEALRTQLAEVDAAYFDIQRALGGDSLDDAHAAAGRYLDALSNVDMTLFAQDAHMAWMMGLTDRTEQAQAIAGAADIAAARAAFKPLSAAQIVTVRQFGPAGGDSVYQFHCPMADGNTGADWLQDTADIFNPYFGAAMPTCGSVVETFPAAGM